MSQLKRLTDIIIEEMAARAFDDRPPTAEYLARTMLENGVIDPPCKIGDTVYYLATECDRCTTGLDYCQTSCKKPKGFTHVQKMRVQQFRIYGNQFDCMTDSIAAGSTYSHDFCFCDWGIRVFSTEQGAKAALKKETLKNAEIH